MKYSSMNLFSIILIIFVVFILFLCSPVYKLISGEGGGFGMGRLIEGMTPGENGLMGNGTSQSPFIVPATLIVRPGDSNWKQKIKNNDKTESGVTEWIINDQFKTPGPPKYIGDQFQYFAELWLAKLNAKPGQTYATSIKAVNQGVMSNYGDYTFSITAVNSNGNGKINYSGIFERKAWGWETAPLSPAPEPYKPPTTASGATIPDPTKGAMSGFASKKCNSASTRDGNCIPVCVPLNMMKVSGPAYGDPKNAMGPDGKPFNQNTANYFYEKSDTGSGGEYYPVTDTGYSRLIYGSLTDCTQDYACSPSGLPGSDGAKAQCRSQPAPPKPTPSGPCDPSCRKVKDPRYAGSACKLDKSLDKSIYKIVCSACPLVDGEINCNNYMATCSGCGNALRARFDPNKPYPAPEPKEKPFTPTECETNCEKPGVEIFKNYLNTFRDGSGFDDGSCEIVGKNIVKCRAVRKGVNMGVGAGAGAGAGSNGGMKPIPAPDECVLCQEENLHGYAEFDRKWDNYAKQNDYVNIKLVDGPPRNGDKGGGGGGGGGRGRGAKYGPSDGSASRDSNWSNWEGRGSGSDAGGWRGNRGSGAGGAGGGGWYQSLSDAKSKSFQVAASNAESSRQQAYIESLKLELNKVNDDYTTQQTEVNKMKASIDKMLTACQSAKSKLSDAMSSSVSDNMNRNAAITLKENLDAIANTNNINSLQQSVKKSCDNSTKMSESYNAALKQLTATDIKRQALIEKLVVAMNALTENKTTININIGGGAGGVGDCGNHLGCGTGINYNNMYTNDYFKPQRIDEMINNMNVPMPYQDLILF